MAASAAEENNSKQATSTSIHATPDRGQEQGFQGCACFWETGDAPSQFR